MQTISRIYLGNCGYTGAWYDGVTLDLTDPDTALPTDTILNLENGGGKTSLLGLIFSCFETSQDRFLKHIQNKNDHFSQYFSPDGLPGIILVEWLMPARTVASGMYRLVIGQTVSMKAGAEQHESDRVFFSFESRDGLEFTDVPGPRLVETPATTMAEFTRWLSEAQKKHSGTVYHTRKQSDWHRHLRDECLIDLEMLQMQVNFSAVEGGFDTGFLRFDNEIEFLRKFFHLTLDADQTRTVREGVALACDKLRRKPQFERRLSELSKLLGVLQNFDTSAQVHQRAKADQSGVLVAGAVLAVALQQRSVSRKTQGEAEVVFEVQQRSIGGNSLATRDAHLRDELTLTSLLLNKQVNRSKEEKDRAQENFKDTERKILHIKAARLGHEIDTFSKRLAELDTSHVQALDGLKPFLRTVEVQGALLRWVLNDQRKALLAQIEELGRQAELRKLGLGAHKAAVTQLAQQEKSTLNEHALLKANLEIAVSKKKVLHEEGYYLDAAELTFGGIQRWTDAARVTGEEKSGLEAEKSRLETLATSNQQLAKSEGIRAATLGGQVDTLRAFIGEGEAEREHLSQLPALQHAAQADLVDPDSATLLILLEAESASSAREVSFSDVRLAELNASRQSIEETGVAGRSADVELVLARLRKAGLRSARTFSGYIAEALTNTDKARALVLSNPARFLGIAVAIEEMPLVRSVDWALERPGKPVLVSPYALEPQEPAVTSEALVVPASSDAAYNKAAAQALGLSLAARITAEETLKSAYSKRYSDALSARQRLQGYLVRFGEGKLRAAQAEVLARGQDREMAKAAEAEATAQATLMTNAARAKTSDISEKEKLSGLQAIRAATLQQFWDEYEAEFDQRQDKLRELAEVLVGLESHKLELEEAAALLVATGNQEFITKVNLDALAAALFTEIGTIGYFDKTYDVKSHLQVTPSDPVTLRGTYRDSRNVLESEESQRLGVLKTMRDSVRVQWEDKKKEYTRDFSGVMKSDLQPFAGLDHTAMLPPLHLEQDDAHLRQVTAEAAFNAATKTTLEWNRQNKVVMAPTPVMLAFTEEVLGSQVEEAQRLWDVASSSAKTAFDAADAAKTRSYELTGLARVDTQQAASLTTGLDLPENPDPELIRLQFASFIDEGDPSETAKAPEPLVLAHDAHSQVNVLIQAHKEKEKTIALASTSAHRAFDALKTGAADKSLGEIEPELSAQLLINSFEAACADSARLLEGLVDRIETTKSNLATMSADFEACVEELVGVTHLGIRVLTSATSPKIRVPAAAQFVGGKQILKMTARFTDLSSDARRQSVRHYLDSLIDTGIIPAKGSDLVAESVLRQQGGKALGLRVLKMVPDESKQYVELDKISNSGGEGVVMAMFLYLLITQLRSETQAKIRKAGGGPLLLDNPFAKATSSAMWQAQRMLAETIGVQLIFATASQDFNAVGVFQRFVRLRRGGKNLKSGRMHLQAVDFQMSDIEEEAA